MAALVESAISSRKQGATEAHSQYEVVPQENSAQFHVRERCGQQQVVTFDNPHMPPDSGLPPSLAASPQSISWYDWLDKETLVVLFSRHLNAYNVLQSKIIFTVQLDSYFDKATILRDRNVVVVGTGEDVEAWDLTDVKNAKRVPLEYMHCDSFQPMEGIEFGYAILPGGRLVDMEIRDGTRCFVIWSIPDQKEVDCIPFPFPETFQPMYAHKVGGKEAIAIGDYGEDHFTFDLVKRVARRIPNNEPEALEPHEDYAETSYFWAITDLGGRFFATLPKDNMPAVLHIWDIDLGCRIANLPVGAEAVNEVRYLPGDEVEVKLMGHTQKWNIRTGSLVSGKVFGDEVESDEAE